MRDYVVLIVSVLLSGIIAFLPTILFLGIIGMIAYFMYKYFASTQGASVMPKMSAQVDSHNRTKELSEDLALAFKRNNMRHVQQFLTRLPPWPIKHHIQHVAQELFELKQSIYRAQAEGVPALMIERYLQNMNQAAEIVWQLASKVDAVNLQNVSYLVVSPRLEQEVIKLQQLQHAIKASHEGIALMILSGTKSDIFQDVEGDLRALTHAVKSLEDAHTQLNLDTTYR